VEPIPETRYAQALDGAQVAYQVAGSGPILMLGFNGLVSVDVMWEEPRFVRFLDRLSSFSRHVWFDPRGTGSSAPAPVGQGRVVESATDDMVTVLDALGEERAVVLGLTPPPALLFAATYPARTAALVLVEPSARFRSDDGYAGLDTREVDRLVAMLEREWGTGVFARLNGWAGDERAQRWYAKAERLMYTPREAAAVFRWVYDVDLRSVLPAISVPTLVVARHQRHPSSLSQSRYVAEHITGADYVELPAGDRLLDALDPIEEFVTGRLPAASGDRVLATILFTDIVDSTAQAAAMGDRAWGHRLDEHDAMVRRQLTRFRGREIKTMGDAFLATFDGPARAIRCGCAIRDEARRLGIQTRAGLHTGEIELRGDDIAGVTVHIAARVAALAGPAEVVLSRTIADLVAGSGISFEDRGEYELKGVPGRWRLFAVTET
jgi:class 3 adenylate cyclase